MAMGVHSGTGSRATLEATLAAMLQWLDAIEAKLEPLAPLQVRVDTIEATLHTHEQQHQDLIMMVMRLEMAQCEMRAVCQHCDH
jgi:hypothetical protein